MTIANVDFRLPIASVRATTIGNWQSEIDNKKAAQLSGGPRSASFLLERQLPTNRGGRFSKKAATPSTKSFVLPDSICILRSRSNWPGQSFVALATND